MATNELDKLYVSQCISSDYCRGWNAAVEIANKTIERLEKLLDDKCDRISIVFDKLDKCLTFGATDGVYVSMHDIDRIKKELTGKE